ncbi:glutamine-rich protein 2-like [Gadus chalcogrammus]|uniref:glutamine-rich protein 2-like n=1 Tax=Gadus chalcogrammus TaxID=1042646 RepID=UPI0024C4B142|nr:glutamine-rich protein 2-like [Gadus chalcogrammus]
MRSRTTTVVFLSVLTETWTIKHNVATNDQDYSFSNSGPHRTGLLRPGPDFRDLVRASETWSGLQRPGPDFRDLVRTSETWSGLQRPGPGFRDRASNQTAGGRWLCHSEGELEVDWGGVGRRVLQTSSTVLREGMAPRGRGSRRAWLQEGMAQRGHGFEGDLHLRA